MRGFLLIDKEKGMSSFDVVREIKRTTGEKKVGHSGTLDPLATGLMLIAIGEATKLLEYFIGCDKEYIVETEFGKISDTYDAEGIIEDGNPEIVSKNELARLIKEKFSSEIEQIPPKYSALKINGKRACDRVRNGEKVSLKPRKVNVYSFDIVEYRWPYVGFQIKCGSGTYVRSLINDLGQACGCGAYVLGLKRTYIGGFKLKDSCKLNNLSKNVVQRLILLEALATKYPKFELNDKEFDVLKNGGVLVDKKIDHEGLVFALYRGKVAGVLEDFKDGGVKFKKMLKFVNP